MQLGIGLGIGLLNRVSPWYTRLVPYDYEIDLTSSIPAGYTYTNSSTVCTLRNSSGNLVRSTANVPRYSHDIDGNPLGVAIEASRTNRFTGKYLPTDTTGFSVTGTATIGLTTDATALGVEKLSTLCTGNVYEADGGASGGTVLLPGTNDTTGVWSLSVYVRVVSGSGATLTHNGTSPGSTSISGSAYTRVALENQTLSATGKQMIISVPAGCIVRFILAQLEKSEQISTIIVTSGATVTTSADTLYGPSQAGMSFDEGACLIQGSFISRNAASRFLITLSDSNTSYLDIREGSNNPYPEHRVLNTLVTSASSSVNPDRNIPWSGGINWKSGEMGFISGGGANQITAKTDTATGMNRLSIGCSSTGFFQESMYIKKVYLWKKYVPLYNLGQYMYDDTWKGIIVGGQSLIATDIRTQNESLPTGERSFNAALDAVFSSMPGKNVEIMGATNGSALLKKNGSGTNWWYDPDTGTYGAAWDTWERAAKNFIAGSGTIKAIYYSGHESDYYGLDNGNTTKAEWKSAFLVVLSKMRSIVGNLPLIFEPIGRRIDTATYDEGIEFMAECQRELAAENPGSIYVGPEKIDMTIYPTDTVHLDATSQGIKAGRNVRYALTVTGDISGQNTLGPHISSVSRSGSSVSLTVGFDAGETAITPTSGIVGVRFFDGASEITVSSCTYSGGVITATLASTPSNSNQTVYVGYGGMYSELAGIANYPKGNGANALPMRREKFVSSDTGTTFANGLDG